jgi:predicted DCC family thiol-disulfide oxidoreductase YuxK
MQVGSLPGLRPYDLAVTSPALTVLFDGNCRFCTRSARAVQRRFGRARIAVQDFQEPGALGRYPAVTLEAAMDKMHVVLADGRVFAGAEAFARVVASIPYVGWVAFLYYVPGLRRLADLAYRLVSRHRYRLFGKAEACDGGTCHLHET